MKKSLLMIILVLISFVLISCQDVKTEHTVKFLTDGGSLVSDQTVKDGELVTKPEDPIKEDFLFKFWTLDGLEFSFDTPVKNDLTLVANWDEVLEEEPPEVVSYDVIFVYGQGIDSLTVTVISGNKVTEPEEPVKEGFIFNGWYIENELYDFNSVVNNDITLNAKWEEK